MLSVSHFANAVYALDTFERGYERDLMTDLLGGAMNVAGMDVGYRGKPFDQCGSRARPSKGTTEVIEDMTSIPGSLQVLWSP